ncbi:hypothetical protein ABER61_04500 [Brevibacillus formosus]|uniref:hypothetical protein n=1 Tax=Brevibacillus formosus TaxID=54913 RepID=UPI0011B25322|nr:hypothetical protein [Brevibacillus formosus]
METMDTMLLEMVHLYNAVKGVQDTSRNGTYHNKRFKAECERRGFYFPDKEPDKKYGWAFQKLAEETKKKIMELEINQGVFVIARKAFGGGGSGGGEGEKKSNSYKWVCPGCELTVRSSKPDISVRCGECDLLMIEE